MVPFLSECCYFEMVKNKKEISQMDGLLKCDEMNYRMVNRNNYWTGLKLSALNMFSAFRVKGVYVFLFLSCLISSCSLNSEETFLKLQSLEGSWKSDGSILVHQQWKQWPDSLIKGILFSVTASDSTIVERYIIFKKNDSIYLQLDMDLHQCLMIHEASFSEISFVNDQRSYPNKITIEWESDSVFIFKKENSRGNKPIEFRLKRD